MFKVSMTDLGRKHATESEAFERAPEWDDLYGMAARHLLSNSIYFSIRVGDPDAADYPVTGSVLAGAHHVGDFKIEEAAG